MKGWTETILPSGMVEIRGPDGFYSNGHITNIPDPRPFRIAGEAAVTMTVRENLYEQMKSGLVENQTFLIPDPGRIVVGGEGTKTILRNCLFIWLVPCESDHPFHWMGGTFNFDSCLLYGGNPAVPKEHLDYVISQWQATQPDTPERDALRLWCEENLILQEQPATEGPGFLATYHQAVTSSEDSP